jgi:hypothetical protein
MNSLAHALVESAAFIELSSDEVIDPDAAVRALESIVSALSEASEEEKKAVITYCSEQAAAIAAKPAPRDEERREFYLKFEESFGLTDE